MLRRANGSHHRAQGRTGQRGCSGVRRHARPGAPSSARSRSQVLCATHEGRRFSRRFPIRCSPTVSCHEPCNSPGTPHLLRSTASPRQMFALRSPENRAGRSARSFNCSPSGTRRTLFRDRHSPCAAGRLGRPDNRPAGSGLRAHPVRHAGEVDAVLRRAGRQAMHWTIALGAGGPESGNAPAESANPPLADLSPDGTVQRSRMPATGRCVNGRGASLVSTVWAQDRMERPAAVSRQALNRVRNRLFRLGHNGNMRRASVSEVKNSLDSVLGEVRRGETVLVTHRGKPVAQIRPCDADVPSDEAAAKLVQQDLADPPRASLDLAAFVSRRRPRLPEGCTASRLIAAERDGNS